MFCKLWSNPNRSLNCPPKNRLLNGIYYVNRAPAHVTAAIIKYLRRKSTDPNHFLQPVHFLPRESQIAIVFFLVLGNNDFLGWCKFPWETITWRKKSPFNAHTANSHAWWTHSFNSRLKQYGPFFCGESSRWWSFGCYMTDDLKCHTWPFLFSPLESLRLNTLLKEQLFACFNLYSLTLIQTLQAPSVTQQW